MPACDEEVMRVVLACLISLLAACHREVPVTFSPGAPPPEVEVETRHQLSLALSIGVGDEVEAQTLVDEARVRARVERRQDGTVVRWLEHTGPEAARFEGRSVMVSSLAVRAIAEQTTVGALEATEARRLAEVSSGPDALQVELMRQPVRRRERSQSLDDTFGALAARALGEGVAVKTSSLRLEAATDSVAVFSANLVAMTHAGPVTMTYDLRGTFEVRRADTFPLALALEGPVTVRSEHTGDDQPQVTGSGTLVVLHRARDLRQVISGAVADAR